MRRLGAVRANIGRPGPHRGGLAEIDAVEPRQQVDHLAPDRPRFDADAGIMTVNRGGTGQVPRRVANHPHRSAGISLAEHDAGRAGLDCRQDQVDNLVGPCTDMRRKDQPQPAAAIAYAFDGFQRAGWRSPTGE